MCTRFSQIGRDYFMNKNRNGYGKKKRIAGKRGYNTHGIDTWRWPVRCPKTRRTQRRSGRTPWTCTQSLRAAFGRCTRTHCDRRPPPWTRSFCPRCTSPPGTMICPILRRPPVSSTRSSPSPSRCLWCASALAARSACLYNTRVLLVVTGRVLKRTSEAVCFGRLHRQGCRCMRALCFIGYYRVIRIVKLNEKGGRIP